MFKQISNIMVYRKQMIEVVKKIFMPIMTGHYYNMV